MANLGERGRRSPPIVTFNENLSGATIIPRASKDISATESGKNIAKYDCPSCLLKISEMPALCEGMKPDGSSADVKARGRENRGQQFRTTVLAASNCRPEPV